ncbi:MAG: SPOR domain-containing protein [Alphaproteobacteria bacterium]|nr:SPOR domain-containing protein [Alphaproteobacteria bacterium]
MKRPPQRELFVSERPERSDYSHADWARERSYARRRVITVTVLVLAIVGGAYGLWGRHASAPGEIPTVATSIPYKHKPANPGGIDIPHQDVQVYNEIDNTPPLHQVEHLLPPPEQPIAPPVATTVTPTPAPAAAPKPALATAAKKTAAKTAVAVPAPVPVPKPVALKPVASKSLTPKTAAAAKPAVSKPRSPTTIAQVIKETEHMPVPNVSAAGTVVVQLASVSDETKAEAMMEKLQRKYAGELGSATLRLARADLGARGVFYRIRSQPLSESAANHICSALKKKHAGCILVR